MAATQAGKRKKEQERRDAEASNVPCIDDTEISHGMLSEDSSRTLPTTNSVKEVESLLGPSISEANSEMLSNIPSSPSVESADDTASMNLTLSKSTVSTNITLICSTGTRRVRSRGLAERDIC